VDIKSLVPRENDDDVKVEEEPRGKQQYQQGRIEQISNTDDLQMDVADTSLLSSTDSEGDKRVTPRRRNRNDTKVTFSFMDVEDTIRPFDGSDHYPIEKWISDFEELAILFKWNDMQKLVFGRKSKVSLKCSCVDLVSRSLGRS